MEITISHLSGSGTGRVESFMQDTIRLGRSDSCHLRFDPDKDIKVSGEHCEIKTIDGERLEVTDLNSRNGTYVNGTRISAPTSLPNHGTLQLGDGGPRLQFKYEGGGGISFTKLKERKQKTDRLKKRGEVLRATEDEMATYNEADLKDPQGLQKLLGGRDIPIPVLIGGACIVLAVVLLIVSRLL
ncbi:FHA domain-containing protein [Planctomycetota bacterium]|nr:FHA domain-containing protein [Planctomycetota bacterium]